jgi:alpha-1,3-rhamnosyl/mannosyltransferase
MGQYVFELVKQSQPQHQLEWHLFADDVRSPMTVPQGPKTMVDVFSFRGDRFQLWEQLGLPLRTLKRHVDLLHCTETTLPLWQPKPTVVTVHDTLPWDKIDEEKSTSFYFNKLLPAAMNKSAAIITISESSKHDILKRWPWLESKLSVIYHGIANEYFTEEHTEIPSSLREYLGNAPYVVYLGGPMERKRFTWALQVLSSCAQKSVKLVACGFNAEAREKAYESLPTEMHGRVHFAEFLSNSDMRALYRKSQAVLYPTLYEGFGFPAVEAQAAGVPVLFSPLGSLQELVGPLAFVLPPFELDAWQNALTEALSMGPGLAEKAQAAKRWARSFSWSESFEKHLAVYRQVAHARPDTI